MSYLLSQLFLYLICALLLGLLLGWVIWGWWGRRSIDEMKAEGERVLRAQQQKCEAEKAELQAIIDEQAASLEKAKAAPSLEKAKASPSGTSATTAKKAEKFMTDAPKPAALYETRPAEVDDLKEIKGIGPVMERILNDNGCYHFKQLANFSKQDIEWISAAIQTFPDRIERDRWVEQAEGLHFRKYGERLSTK